MIPTSIRCNFCGADNNIFSSEEITDTKAFILAEDSDNPSDAPTDVSMTNPRQYVTNHRNYYKMGFALITMLSVFMIMNPGQSDFGVKSIGKIRGEMRILEENLVAKTALATLEELPIVLKEKAQDID